MAQVLIRKRKHFAEDAQPVQWDALKWSGRPLTGDVVEARENGYWRIEALGTGVHGWDRDAFALIQITNLSLLQIATWQGSYSNATDTTPATKWFKNRYRLAAWATLPWIKTTVVVDGKTFEEWYYIRSNIHSIVTPTDKAAP